MTHKIDEIQKQIENVYGSLDQPRFDFVWVALNAQVYATLRQRLSAHFELTENTRPDDDVSFGLVLETREGRRVLRLSMVGRYAMLLRIIPGAPAEVIAPGAKLTGDEARILAELESDEIQLLDRKTLDEPIGLQLFGVEREKTRLYQALFVDSDVIPWEYVHRDQ